MSRTVVAYDALPEYLRNAVAAGSERDTCPRCDGGSKREVTLSIRYQEDGVVTFKCYRSTCDWFGATLTGTAERQSRKLKIGKVYREPTVPICAQAMAVLVSDYGLFRGQINGHGWRLTADGKTLVMPLLDYYGRERGHITRTLYEKEKRVYTYKATSQPFLDWWFDPYNEAPVVVVEDTLSACRLSGLGYNAVALLGTGMSQADAREIAQAGKHRKVYLALDRDAFDKAIKLRDRHAHILSIDRVICLQEDIKNIEHDDDIRQILGDEPDGRDVTSGGDLREQKSL